jgi:hypothetical protein
MVSSPDLSFVYPLVREMPAVTIDERSVIVRLTLDTDAAKAENSSSAADVISNPHSRQ